MGTSKNILTTLALLFGAATLSAAPAWGQEAAAPDSTKAQAPLTDDSLPDAAPGSLEIAVVDACGRAVPGASVEAMPVTGSPALNTATTDSSGLAKLDKLRPGKWFIAAYDYRGNFVWQIVEIKSGQHLALAITLPIDIGDINGDDVVNSSDFFDFIHAWSNGEDLGDFNHNGRVDSQDFFDYIAVFMNGCGPVSMLLPDSVE